MDGAWDQDLCTIKDTTEAMMVTWARRAVLNEREGATQEMTNPELRSGPGSPTQLPELRDPEEKA